MWDLGLIPNPQAKFIPTLLVVNLTFINQKQSVYLLPDNFEAE
jgi:hypothetical protein